MRHCFIAIAKMREEVPREESTEEKPKGGTRNACTGRGRGNGGLVGRLPYISKSLFRRLTDIKANSKGNACAQVNQKGGSLSCLSGEHSSPRVPDAPKQNKSPRFVKREKSGRRQGTKSEKRKSVNQSARRYKRRRFPENASLKNHVRRNQSGVRLPRRDEGLKSPREKGPRRWTGNKRERCP